MSSGSLRYSGNLAGGTIRRQLAQGADQLSSTFQRLSSGVRIQSAKDDPAGLAVAASLESNAAVYTQAKRNVQDGISAFNLVSSALTDLQNIVVKQKELAAQASNTSLSSVQRSALDAEADAMVAEFNRILGDVEYNNSQLLVGNGQSMRIQGGYGSAGGINFRLGDYLTYTSSVERGDGTYLAMISSPGSGNMTAVGVDTADFNGDGNLDLVTANFSGGFASVFLGNGNGTFKAYSSYGIAVSSYFRVDTSDINSDGFADFVVTDYSNGKVGVALGNGNGTFKAMLSYVAGTSVRDVKAEDLNGDGYKDLVVTSYDASNRVMFLFGNGNGTFKAGVSYSTGTNPGEVTLGDVNADGLSDLVVTINGSVDVLLGNGNGSFKARTSYVGLGQGDVTIHDINNDGYQDLITGSTPTVLLGNGNGTFKSANQVVSLPGASFYSTHLVDINGDGYMDITGSDFVGVKNYIALGNGNGTFLAPVSFAGLRSQEVTAGDFDNDGFVDLVTISDQANLGIGILLGNSSVVSTVRITQADLDLTTTEGAEAASTALGVDYDRVQSELGNASAALSRLDVASRYADVMSENYLAAKGRILDINVAEETATMVKLQVLQDARKSLAAQANQEAALVMKLITEA